MTEDKTLYIDRVLASLPHRYPFVMVDRILDYELDDFIVGVKNVTINEPFFDGHFPHRKVFPGVLMIEAMAQCAGVLAQLSVNADPSRNPLFYLVKIEHARFSRPVVPGDQLSLHVVQKRLLRGMGLFEGEATVAGDRVARAGFLCAEQKP